MNTKVLLTFIVIFTVAIVSTGCINEPQPNDSENNTQTWYIRSAEGTRRIIQLF